MGSRRLTRQTCLRVGLCKHMQQDYIRNFAIIAHIDHGKSTLADRLMEMTHTVSQREMHEQMLDSNPIERERGITIKLAPVRMLYIHKTKDNEQGTENCEHKTENLSHADCPMSYILNLIDTPGHVDFTYEVSRSLAACEGALLVVDASQGVQAQTLANLHLARSNNLKVIPIINKIDLPNARIEETRREIVELGFSNDEIIEISAKTGTNVEQVLEAIVERIPAPNGSASSPLRALVFSSQYDPHKGVVVFVRVVDGSIGGRNSVRAEVAPPWRGSPRERQPWSSLRFLASGAEVTPIEIGYFMPSMMPSDGLFTGEVGYIATGLKDVRLAKVGDTITVENMDNKQKAGDSKMVSSAHCPMSNDIQPLAGYHEPKPMVFVGLYPIREDNFTKARESMEKLRLSDSAFTFRPVSSLALGNGFHSGFLGLLHAEIVQERLSREFGLDLLATAPSVEYQITLKSGVDPGKIGLSRIKLENRASKIGVENREWKIDRNNDQSSIFHPPPPSSILHHPCSSIISIQNPSEFPDPSFIEEVREPIMSVTIFSPKRYTGAIMQLCQEKRGAYVDLVYHAGNAEFSYLIPLSEMIVDFFDRLKSVTEGYASLDYEFFEYQPVEVVKVDILVNHEKVDALAFMIVKSEARRRGGEIVKRLAEVLPRQQFSIPIQAAIGGEIIARDDIKPFRKDVIAKLYGGDRTRKDKLLKKQKKGKTKMKMIGKVEIPQGAFFDVLKR